MSITANRTKPSTVPAAAVRTLAVCVVLATSGVQLPGQRLTADQPTTVPVPDRTSVNGDPGPVDFIQPRPLLDSDWTSRALSALSLTTLEFAVMNASATPMPLTATLLWDAGTTEGRTTIVDRFVVAAGSTLVRRIDPERIPAGVRGERYPGLVQLSLESDSGDTAVLPAFFVMPRTTGRFAAAAAWPYELMDADRLEAATRDASQSDQEGGIPVRAVEWRQSTIETSDENGGGR
jgi:hypothetical protein